MRRITLTLSIVVLAAGGLALPRHLISHTSTVTPDFTHFESAHVHPAVLTPSGARLLVVNTPDNRLSVFDVTGPMPVKVGDIPVGLEPVSVACRDDSTAWVVNNVSDDVSIVNLNTLHTKATLRVGDEPNDVVFAGNPLRAYVSVSQEDAVKVYDPNTPGSPLTVIAINGRMPRALAKNPAATLVYVASFNGGTRTTVIAPNKIPVDSMPQDPVFPRNPSLPPTPPRVGLIVQQIAPGNHWFDIYNNLWDSKINYNVPDVDVAEISTATDAVLRTFAGAGSINFDLAVNPAGTRLSVVTTESRDLHRFEPGVIGYVAQTQVAFFNLSTGALSALREVDKPLVDYDQVPGTQQEADSSLGIPTGVAYSSNGLVTYVTSFATDKLGVLNPNGGATTTVKARVPTVAGPTGVVVDDARNRLYIVGRFHNELQTLSTFDFSQVARTPIGFDPTPSAIVNGRKFLYGGFTSAHGEQSCASCHVFGDGDNIAWDLGDPTGAYVPPPISNPNGLHGFDPMKGPMMTQSLRGLAATEPLHWRGDRANIHSFNPAFVTLMGRANSLTPSEMTALADSFLIPLVYPPNPYENLDRTMPDAPSGQGSAARGKTFFENTVFDGSRKCADCHSGAAGTNREILSYSVIGGSQDLKVPHLRALYRKLGYRDSIGVSNKRGFGFTHDGSVDNLMTLLGTAGLHFVTDPADRADLQAYLLSFDTGTAPAVGYQITFDGSNNSNPTAIARMDTLEGQADASNCDLIAKGRVGGLPRGWLYQGAGMWTSDEVGEAAITSATLRALGGLGSEVTVTGVPFGSGHRAALDRDRDSYYDADELIAGSDPGDPNSTPNLVGVTPGVPAHEGLDNVRPNPFRVATDVHFTLARRGRVDVTIYDVLGRQVKSVARGLALEAGPQNLRWDGATTTGASAPAGVYFVRLATPTGHWTRTVIRVR